MFCGFPSFLLLIHLQHCNCVRASDPPCDCVLGLRRCCGGGRSISKSKPRLDFGVLGSVEAVQGRPDHSSSSRLASRSRVFCFARRLPTYITSPVVSSASHTSVITSSVSAPAIPNSLPE